MMRRDRLERKCRIALIAIAGRYSANPTQKRNGSGRPNAEAKFCGPCGFMPQAFTLDVMEAITIDAILNCSSRLTMPCRSAIHAKSVLNCPDTASAIFDHQE